MNDAIQLGLLESEWSTGVVPDRSGLAAYIVAIRSPRDPERRDRARSLGGTTMGCEKQLDLKRWKTWPMKAWGFAIIDALEASPTPLTFSALGVIIADKTADALLGSVAEEALWTLVEVGRVEHTRTAPVLFRLRDEANHERKTPCAASSPKLPPGDSRERATAGDTGRTLERGARPVVARAACWLCLGRDFPRTAVRFPELGGRVERLCLRCAVKVQRFDERHQIPTTDTPGPSARTRRLMGEHFGIARGMFTSFRTQNAWWGRGYAT